MEPQKPFACGAPECGMAFTNEDHLHVHTRKHDMMLQLGAEQKVAFVVDQTPTPTSFIRSCEDVGLFQALQDLTAVNPFDEGFKRAIENNTKLEFTKKKTDSRRDDDNSTNVKTKETRAGLQPGDAADDALHTPQMFPAAPAAPAAAPAAPAAAAAHRHITISRSSSDDTGSIKEYETTTISKLTNEVTTISRVIGKQETERGDDVTTRHETPSGDLQETVSYTNNVIQILSNVEIKKESQNAESKAVGVKVTDSAFALSDKPMFTQKSIDYVVDSFTSTEALKRGESLIENDNVGKVIKDNQDTKDGEKNYRKRKIEEQVKNNDDFEVILRFPNQKCVRMKAIEEVPDEGKTKVKEKLKEVLEEKNERETKRPSMVLNNFALPLVYPVTPCRVILNNVAPIIVAPAKIPIKASVAKVKEKVIKKESKKAKVKIEENEVIDEHKCLLERRSAASKRYRAKQRQSARAAAAELGRLRAAAARLAADNARLRALLAAAGIDPGAPVSAD